VQRFGYGLSAIALVLAGPAALIGARAIEVGAGPAQRWVVEEIDRAPLIFVFFGVFPLIVVAAAGYTVGALVEVLESRALHDGLTGLWNRRYGEERLGSEIARSGRDRRPLSVLLVDLDHLKEINDRDGHAAGDRALRRVARTIAAACRRSDVPVRWAGDEFVVITPSTSLGMALKVADRIRLAVAADGTCSVSVGVAELSPAYGAAELIAAADRALYLAKAGGRDRVTSIDLPLLAPREV
jgi:diguanylate cyclase (GGDEF)-like protein